MQWLCFDILPTRIWVKNRNLLTDYSLYFVLNYNWRSVAILYCIFSYDAYFVPTCCLLQSVLFFGHCLALSVRPSLQILEHSRSWWQQLEADRPLLVPGGCSGECQGADVGPLVVRRPTVVRYPGTCPCFSLLTKVGFHPSIKKRS